MIFQSTVANCHADLVIDEDAHDIGPGECEGGDGVDRRRRGAPGQRPARLAQEAAEADDVIAVVDRVAPLDQLK